MMMMMINLVAAGYICSEMRDVNGVSCCCCLSLFLSFIFSASLSVPTDVLQMLSGVECYIFRFIMLA